MSGTSSCWQGANSSKKPSSDTIRWHSLLRRRAEVVERTFAHVCTTGGARRSWIRGLAKVGKRYLVTVMAHNLGVILRKLIGVGKPREWASMRSLLATCAALWSTILVLPVTTWRWIDDLADRLEDQWLGAREHSSASQEAASSTGC